MFYLDLVKQHAHHHQLIHLLLNLQILAALQIQTVAVIEQLALAVLPLLQIVLQLDLQVTTEILLYIFCSKIIKLINNF